MSDKSKQRVQANGEEERKRLALDAEAAEAVEIEVEEVADAEELTDGAEEASVDSQRGSNRQLRAMMESNYIEYASYVIKERAIPDVDDGLKPVQRRILWSLFRMHDGKFHKVANVIGHAMQYHPHGDASIGSALVVLANKEYFIEKQGNFGNILTGDAASAARYIECRLSPLAVEVLFNNDITEFIDSYDGRNREPVVLPVKIPSLLMLGTQGIAVGMATNIMPHNFNELLQAQIAVLRGESFTLYPDFLQGGLMDVAEYNQGNGKITLRAKIDRDGRKLIVREIPATTTTERLIASIEKAVERNKIKVAAINDYTTEEVEIEIVPMRGQNPDKMVNALYRYTDCEVSVSVNMMVICENRPVQMTVETVIERNTKRLLAYLKQELEIELGKLEDALHNKTLAQIFIEQRIYKRIEECKTSELVFSEIYRGFEPYRERLSREITDNDIKKLLEIPIRRISLFDIEKNQREIADIELQIKTVKRHLRRLTAYAIKYLEELLAKYGDKFPRCTVIEEFDKIDRRAVALNNIKVGWDRKNCYIGTNVKSEDQVTCNEFDHLLCLERKGKYRIINIPEKIFTGRLYDFRKYDKNIEFGVIYRENKSGKFYGKRCFIDKYITDREYLICPEGCRLEVFTARTDAIYKYLVETRRGAKELEINLKELPLRSAKARGILINPRPVTRIKHLRYLTEEELEVYQGLPSESTASANETERPAVEPADSKESQSPSHDNGTDSPTETSVPKIDKDGESKAPTSEKGSKVKANRAVKADAKSSVPSNEEAQPAKFSVVTAEGSKSTKAESKKTGKPGKGGHTDGKKSASDKVATSRTETAVTDDKNAQTAKMIRKTDKNIPSVTDSKDHAAKITPEETVAVPEDNVETESLLPPSTEPTDSVAPYNEEQLIEGTKANREASIEQSDAASDQDEDKQDGDDNWGITQLEFGF